MKTMTFDEYGLAYLAGHEKPMTRFIHYLGLFVAPLAGIAASVFWARWAFFVIVPVLYIAARVTHPLLEHNSNEPFAERPLWSAIAFLRMLALDATGQLGTQLKRAHRASA